MGTATGWRRCRRRKSRKQKAFGFYKAAAAPGGFGSLRFRLADSRSPMMSWRLRIYENEDEHEYEYERCLSGGAEAPRRKAQAASRKPILARCGSSCSRPKTHDARPPQVGGSASANFRLVVAEDELPIPNRVRVRVRARVRALFVRRSGSSMRKPQADSRPERKHLAQDPRPTTQDLPKSAARREAAPRRRLKASYYPA